MIPCLHPIKELVSWTSPFESQKGKGGSLVNIGKKLVFGNMIRIITMLSLLSAVFCQYPRQRAPPLHQNPPPQRTQNYEQPPPSNYEDDDQDYRPQPRHNVIHQPAPVHYVNIGAELAGDYKFGYDTGKGDSGQSFREETRLPDGTVQGAYGYIDETGKQRIVKYTAGKEGFKVVSDAGSNEEKTPRSNPQPRQSGQSYNQPEVHQQAYRQPQPQQAYRPSTQQAYSPPQQSYSPPQQVSRAQPVEYAPSSQPNYRTQPAYRAAPEPQRSYAPEPQRSYAPEPQRSYAPEPQAYAPEPQAYAPEPQAYAPERQAYAPRSGSRGRAGSRYVPEPVSRYQNDEEDYDYPDNEITERRLAPIDTSLLNYNIGTGSGGRA